MPKKKKKKLSTSKQQPKDYKRKKPLFVRFQIPGGKDAMLIESKHLQRAIDELYKGHKPDSKAAKVITHNLQQVIRHERMNWTGFILFCETLKITPSGAYRLLGKHFAQEKIAKAKVGFLNEVLVKSLLKKMDKWGGVPKAWKNHRGYINSFCKHTNTPLFRSLSNFQDHVTVWKELTVGKRNWKKVGGYDSRGDKEFSIFNQPKSYKK